MHSETEKLLRQILPDDYITSDNTSSDSLMQMAIHYIMFLENKVHIRGQEIDAAWDQVRIQRARRKFG